MNLETKLAEIREGAKTRIPAATLAAMQKATTALRDSGILKGVIKPGAQLPLFTLAGARGNTVNSTDLLARGALVLTVYRGHW